MKTHFVREIEPNQPVTSFFLVQAKEARQNKSGEMYLSMVLGDRTGALDARMWDGAAEVAATFEKDDFVKVQGIVQLHRNRPQMNVHKLRRVEAGEIEIADYFPRTEKDVGEMWAELRATAAAVANPHLNALLAAFLDDEEIASRLRIAPAAKTLHHARIGGLLEHIVSLLRLSRFAAGHYPFLDGDLLITGAVLHDVGKIYELRYDRSFGYTVEGQLLGHMTYAVEMVERKAAAIPEFPPKLKTLVKHLILSHHGRYEFGSPRLPLTPEALVLHYLDDLDSKAESARASIESGQNIEGEWTAYNASLERALLRQARYLDETER